MVNIRLDIKVENRNLRQLINKCKKTANATVGIHKKDNKKYPNADVTTAEVGYWQEFGHFTKGGNFVLPKVWLRTFHIDERAKKELKAYARSRFAECDTIEEAMTDVAAYMSDYIKERIRNNEVVPHSNKDGITLIDTGQLVNSIDFEVEK